VAALCFGVGAPVAAFTVGPVVAAFTVGPVVAPFTVGPVVAPFTVGPVVAPFTVGSSDPGGRGLKVGNRVTIKGGAMKVGKKVGENVSLLALLFDFDLDFVIIRRFILICCL